MRADAVATPATVTFTAVFEKAEEGGYCVFVEELPGAISQGETLDEARENIKDAIQLVLEVNRERILEGVDEARVIREQLVIHR
ncbi:MAG: type II toxin-antitoxin system HicB family antitoxin [Acidobacteriota bacterium]|nr:type II toxin-antitoxin system HicB family antitoxin [Acidobacteriota bacterium]